MDLGWSIFYKNYISIVTDFFSTYFFICQKDFKLEISIQFVQSYSTQRLHKTLYPDQILDKYKNSNNQKKAQIK